MATTWVLVANASEARLFQRQKAGQGLELIKEFSHPESRAKGIELASDGPGHFQSSGARGAFADTTTPKEYEAERFSMELVKALEAGRVANSYQRLVLVASPHFYGLLNSHMGSQISAMVDIHLSKDYTKLAAKELYDQLSEHVRL